LTTATPAVVVYFVPAYKEKKMFLRCGFDKYVNQDEVATISTNDNGSYRLAIKRGDKVIQVDKHFGDSLDWQLSCAGFLPAIPERRIIYSVQFNNGEATHWIEDVIGWELIHGHRAVYPITASGRTYQMDQPSNATTYYAYIESDGCVTTDDGSYGSVEEYKKDFDEKAKKHANRVA
jgi:hypothetical protein